VEGALRRLEADRLLLYILPDSRGEDVDALAEEVRRALGGRTMEEAVRNALNPEGSRVVRMGGRRIALILSWSSPQGEWPSELTEGLRVRGNLRVFDASYYPLAALQEVAEYDPDAVIFIAAEGETGEVRTRRLRVTPPEDGAELGDPLIPPLLGVNDPEHLSSALASMSGLKEAWVISCPAPCVEGGEDPEVVDACLGGLKRALKDLLEELGFS